MSQVQMEALARQNVGGRWVILGEKFDVSEAEAKEMEGIRPPLAKRVKPQVPQRAPQPMIHREMGASVEDQSPAADTAQGAGKVEDEQPAEKPAEPDPAITTGNLPQKGKGGQYAHRSMRARG